MIIGITGTDGAGKGTVVEYLVAKGFTHYSSRDLLLAAVISAGIIPTRNELRLMGNKMRCEQGDDVIVRKALQEIETNNIKHAVVESVRTLAEAKALQAKRAILLAVDADVALRYQRVQGRRSEKDKVTLEQFVAQEELEKNDTDPHGMQKAKVIEMANYTIFNNGSREDLEVEIEKFLAKYEV
jgi:dephospho-CoA kinase